MRLNPEFSTHARLLSDPAAAIRHLRANLVDHGITVFSRDESLLVEFCVPIEGHHLQITVGADIADDRNRLVIRSVLLRKLTDKRTDLLDLVGTLNNRLAFVTANLLEGDARRLSFESALFLADGACLVGQLDHFISSHVGTLEVYLPVLERYLASDADHAKILAELRE